MRLHLCLLLLGLATPYCAAQDPPARGGRPLLPGFLGIAMAVSGADAEKLAEAERADVMAVCPAGGTDTSREERIVPFRGVAIGSVSRQAGSSVVELHFPYGYDGLYTVLMHKACRDLRLAPSSASAAGYALKGDVPLLAWVVKKPEEAGPAPITPREYHTAETLSVEESQTRFVRPGDNVDPYFVCGRWPRYMMDNPREEWVSIKPANVIRVLAVSREPPKPGATLELWDPGVRHFREMSRDCSLFLVRRAPGDHSSAGMTGVTLTEYGLSHQKWEHWAEDSR